MSLYRLSKSLTRQHAPLAVTVVAPDIAPAFVIPPLVLSSDFEVTSPSASTPKPVIVTVPMVKSPDPSTFVAPVKAPEANVAVPSVKEPPVTAPLAVTVVAPDIAPAFVIPPLVLSSDFEVTSPSASTPKPVIVTVPMVKSPDPSTFVAPVKAPEANVAVPSVKEPPVTAPLAVTVVAPESHQLQRDCTCQDATP